MTTFTPIAASFFDVVLEGICWGAYALLFAYFLVLQFGKKRDITPIVVIICALFILCTVYFGIDITYQYFTLVPGTNSSAAAFQGLNLAESSIFAIIDSLAQMTLIYRCWVLWGKRFIIVAVPIILSITAMAGQFTLVGLLTSSNPNILSILVPIGIASFTLSLVVNALDTGLIVFKIWSLSRTNGYIHSSSATSIRLAVTMMIESGLLLFFSQLVLVVLFAIQNPGVFLVAGPVTQIYGITPTILAVRVSMGTTDISGIPSSSMHLMSSPTPSSATKTYASQAHADEKELSTPPRSEMEFASPRV